MQNQKEKTIGDQFGNVPQCYWAKSDLIVLNDLAVNDFKMPERKKGLNLEQTQSVLATLAKFHALSLAYKAQYPDKFNRLTRVIEEGLFAPETAKYYLGYYRRLSKSTLETVQRGLEEAHVSRSEHYMMRLRTFLEGDTAFKTMCDLVQLKSELSVMCHGDCWTNNFLFRYSGATADDRAEVCLVDFQLMRHSTLALDISNILFCCLDQELRSKHLKALINSYVSELYAALKTYGLEVTRAVCGDDDETLQQDMLEQK